jgi:hypothetical protein
MQFQTTEAYSSWGLTIAVYETNKQSNEEKLKVMERIRSRSFMHLEKRKSTWLWKYNLESKNSENII